MSPRGRVRGGDEGFAMLLVLAATGVLTLFALAAVGAATQSLPAGRQSQDFHAAHAAAMAGVDDYLARLNADQNYFALGDGDPANAAFAPAGRTVPGTAGHTPGDEPRFRYGLVTTPASTVADGLVVLRSTGSVRGEERTVEATMKKIGFADFLYFTEYEALDPALQVQNRPELGRTVGQWTVSCGQHWYDYPTSLDSARCASIGANAEIQFASGDVLDGPVGSNDSFLIQDGATFRDSVQTKWANPDGSGKHWRTSAGGTGGSPVFEAGEPVVTPGLPFPPGNTAIFAEADYTTAGKTGCLFTGPTRIRLLASGSLEVVSPHTKRSGPACGSWPSTAPQLIAAPANGVVYVQDVPASGENASSLDCATQLPAAGMAWPTADTYYYGGYDCRAGDAYVSGDFTGRLTVAAANNVLVTGSICTGQANGTLPGMCTFTTPVKNSVVGLVANNYVYVHHPVRCDSWVAGHTPPLCRRGRTATGLAGVNHNVEIQAAMMSVLHGVGVQNYDKGEAKRGTLRVVGVMTQRYRHPVGRSNTADPSQDTGYLKDYTYDERLGILSPPYFLDPVATQWTVRTTTEVGVP